MAFVFINPRYASLVQSLGLRDPDDFLALQGVIVSGHPDRHVLRLALGAGADEIDTYMKKEHRVPWKERWANALAGRGFVSKSCGEAQMLRQAHRAGIGCPEWVAAGEDGKGRAFLLVRALTGAIDLRAFLRRLAEQGAERRATFSRLGHAVARMHAAGFVHGDLYSKHVLIGSADGSIYFLDWQRARFRQGLGWRRRLHDLAALHATVADHFASPRERWCCLRSYLGTIEAVQAMPVSRRRWTRDFQGAVQTILRRASRLIGHRRVREMRAEPLVPHRQHLIWLDGEALCVTRQLQGLLNGPVPDYLAANECAIRRRNAVQMTPSSIGANARGLLVRRRQSRPLARLWASLRRRRLTAPELEQAGLLFRLERYGLPTPTLFAVGQRHRRAFRTDSFLLTELQSACVSLGAWLQQRSEGAGRAPWCQERGRIIREAASIFHKLGEASCELAAWQWALVDCPGVAGSALLCVQSDPNGNAKVVLGNVAGLRSRRRTRAARTLRWIARTSEALLPGTLSRTDQLRFVLAFLGANRLTSEVKALVRSVRRSSVLPMSLPFGKLRRPLHPNPPPQGGREAASRQTVAEWSAA